MTTNQTSIGRLFAAVCAIAILAPTLEPALVWGQSQVLSANERIPKRIGNIYDHKRHQPTRIEVESAKTAAMPASTAQRDAVIEKLRREIEAIEEAHAPAVSDEFPSWPR